MGHAFSLPLNCRVTRYTFGDSYGAIHVEPRGEESWAVCCDGDVLNDDEEWEWEPVPSQRDEAFTGRTRFDLADALNMAAVAYEEGNVP